ncbi:hypothetical protein ACPXB3_17415 [Gordonia sp. DT219]|uniref:hypothetical protein n=1 Tax=Gordonia sp. DT219 TaxID=3416658 RepID=UPI003CE86D57
MKVIRRITYVGTCLAILGGGVWIWATGRMTTAVLAITVLSGINALAQVRLWYRAVLAESIGSPMLMAAVALPANLLGTISLMLPWRDSSTAVIAMVTALLLGNSIFAVVADYKSIGHAAVASLDTSGQKYSAPAWFLTKSGISYGGLTIIQSVSLTLPATTLTILTLPTKLVASVSGTFINSVLPLMVHQNTSSKTSVRRFINFSVAMLSVLGAALAAGMWIWKREWFAIAAVSAIWLVSSGIAAIAQRMSFRFLRPSAAKVSIIVVPLIVVSVVMSEQFGSLNILVLLCAYALIDALTALMFFHLLREWRGWAVALASVLTLIAVWISQI